MDPPSDQTSISSDSENMTNHEEISSSTFDLEKMALEHGMARLQSLVSRAFDMDAIREVSRTLERTKQLFFESRQTRLHNILEKEKAKAVAEYCELAAKVLQVQLQADELLATSKVPPLSTVLPPPANSNNLLSSIVPIPKLPTYDGDVLQFKGFWDQFEAAVHLREDLQDVTKLVHLRSCLTGAAREAIDGVTTSAENYQAVVQLLHDRFYRPSDVLDAHLLEILNMKTGVVKGKAGLLSLHDRLNRHIVELKAIGRDLDTAVSAFRAVLPLMVSRLPKEIHSRWKVRAEQLSEEQMTAQTFLTFLTAQAHCSVDSEPSTKRERTPSPTHKNTLRANQRKRSNPQRQTVGALHTSPHPICPVCQGEHQVTVCRHFLYQRWSERKAMATRLGMCFICLVQGHKSDRCKFKQCGWRTHHLLTSLSPNRRAPLPEEPDNTTAPPGKKTRPESKSRFQTVKAIAHGANWKRLVISCLFDSGAEKTLVTEDKTKALDLAGMIETVTVRGIGGTIAPQLWPEESALTFLRICDDIQSVPIRCKDWKHLQHLRIPEEQDEKLPIHVLIGIDSYGQILGKKILRGNPADSTDI
ncbi:hypothetical protein T12_909 [Trichinella patagoniensis]|uniref:Peptidase A2 domain-containing protein n=1 Tax=Trichinella patagoniensis TaxID=990121 RepID=A0A0V0ZRW3_9BILA|nr:hypothetical protein T12_909 [Trichinella patagoniensis]